MVIQKPFYAEDIAERAGKVMHRGHETGAS